MSNRERWVIYPLLLFTFLLAAKDKYAPPERIDCSTVSCRFLTVKSADGAALVTIGPSDEDAGALRMYSARSPLKIPSGEPEEDSSLESIRAPGHEILEVGANEYGGYLRLFGAREGSDLQLGHDGKFRFSGLTAVDTEDDYVTVESSSDSTVWGNVVTWPEPAEGPVEESTEGAAEESSEEPAGTEDET